MNRLKYLVGTLAGIGFLPWAPGTWGSIGGLVLIYPVAVTYGDSGLMTLILIGSVLTIWASKSCEDRWGKDPSCFVLDEFTGLAIVYLYTGLGANTEYDVIVLLGGLILFRLFDIIKPLGIKHLQHFPSGFGILLDDLLAGIYGLILLQTALFVVSGF